MPLISIGMLKDDNFRKLVIMIDDIAVLSVSEHDIFE